MFGITKFFVIIFQYSGFDQMNVLKSSVFSCRHVQAGAGGWSGGHHADIGDLHSHL